jgi:hypothetical protein
VSNPNDEQSRLHQKHFGHPFAYGCCGPPGEMHYRENWRPQPPALPVDSDPYPVVIERVPRRPRPWKHSGVRWLLGLGFLAVIVVPVTIYLLGAW